MKRLSACLAAGWLLCAPWSAHAGGKSGVDGTLDTTLVDPPTIGQYPHFVCSSGCSGGNANGQATMANSAPVVIASDQTAVPVSGNIAQETGGNLAASKVDLDAINAAITGTTATSTSATFSITGGSINTFASALASSTTRKGCFIQNPTTATEVIYVFVGANGSAATNKSITLSAGNAFSCWNGLYVLTDNISVSAATNPHAITVISQ